MEWLRLGLGLLTTACKNFLSFVSSSRRTGGWPLGFNGSLVTVLPPLMIQLLLIGLLKVPYSTFFQVWEKPFKVLPGTLVTIFQCILTNCCTLLCWVLDVASMGSPLSWWRICKFCNSSCNLAIFNSAKSCFTNGGHVRNKGGVVNMHVVQATTEALINQWAQHLQNFSMPRTWVQSLYQRMGYTRRTGTTTRPPVPQGLYDECRRDYLGAIDKKMKQYNIPPELVLNSDQTQSSYVSVGKLTMAGHGGQLKVWQIKGLLHWTSLLLWRMIFFLLILGDRWPKKGSFNFTEHWGGICARQYDTLLPTIRPNSKWIWKEFNDYYLLLWCCKTNAWVRNITEDVEVDLRLSVFKPLHAQWLVNMYNFLPAKGGRRVIARGWNNWTLWWNHCIATRWPIWNCIMCNLNL